MFPWHSFRNNNNNQGNNVFKLLKQQRFCRSKLCMLGCFSGRDVVCPVLDWVLCHAGNLWDGSEMGGRH